MADNLMDNYNPLYDVHLRQYFASPHMQKHLRSIGLLQADEEGQTDEEGQLYARHHAMMDMMLRNRETQLVKLADIQRKLDAAEKIEICRKIRSGATSPESHRRAKPSRSLSRSRRSASLRQRRSSTSTEDKDMIQRIESDNDPAEGDPHYVYNRLSASVCKYRYLHKLDDDTLSAYMEQLRMQLNKLERFRDVSFGPHSVAKHQSDPHVSWFFRRRSVESLKFRGRQGKSQSPRQLDQSHDSRSTYPPRRRRRSSDSNRLPPIARNGTSGTSTGSSGTANLPPKPRAVSLKRRSKSRKRDEPVRMQKAKMKEDMETSSPTVAALPALAALGTGAVATVVAFSVDSKSPSPPPNQKSIPEPIIERKNEEMTSALQFDEKENPFGIASVPPPYDEKENQFVSMTEVASGIANDDSMLLDADEQPQEASSEMVHDLESVRQYEQGEQFAPLGEKTPQQRDDESLQQRNDESSQQRDDESSQQRDDELVAESFERFESIPQHEQPEEQSAIPMEPSDDIETVDSIFAVSEKPHCEDSTGEAAHISEAILQCDLKEEVPSEAVEVLSDNAITNVLKEEMPAEALSDSAITSLLLLDAGEQQATEVQEEDMHILKTVPQQELGREEPAIVTEIAADSSPVDTLLIDTQNEELARGAENCVDFAEEPLSQGHLKQQEQHERSEIVSSEFQNPESEDKHAELPEEEDSLIAEQRATENFDVAHILVDTSREVTDSTEHVGENILDRENELSQQQMEPIERTDPFELKTESKDNTSAHNFEQDSEAAKPIATHEMFTENAERTEVPMDTSFSDEESTEQIVKNLAQMEEELSQLQNKPTEHEDISEISEMKNQEPTEAPLETKSPEMEFVHDPRKEDASSPVDSLQEAPIEQTENFEILNTEKAGECPEIGFGISREGDSQQQMSLLNEQFLQSTPLLTLHPPSEVSFGDGELAERDSLSPEEASNAEEQPPMISNEEAGESTPQPCATSHEKAGVNANAHEIREEFTSEQSIAKDSEVLIDEMRSERDEGKPRKKREAVESDLEHEAPVETHSLISDQPAVDSNSLPETQRASVELIPTEIVSGSCDVFDIGKQEEDKARETTQGIMDNESDSLRIESSQHDDKQPSTVNNIQTISTPVNENEQKETQHIIDPHGEEDSFTTDSEVKMNKALEEATTISPFVPTEPLVELEQTAEEIGVMETFQALEVSGLPISTEGSSENAEANEGSASQIQVDDNEANESVANLSLMSNLESSPSEIPATMVMSSEQGAESDPGKSFDHVVDHSSDDHPSMQSILNAEEMNVSELVEDEVPTAEESKTSNSPSEHGNGPEPFHEETEVSAEVSPVEFAVSDEEAPSVQSPLLGNEDRIEETREATDTNPNEPLVDLDFDHTINASDKLTGAEQALLQSATCAQNPPDSSEVDVSCSQSAQMTEMSSPSAGYNLEIENLPAVNVNDNPKETDTPSQSQIDQTFDEMRQLDDISDLVTSIVDAATASINSEQEVLEEECGKVTNVAMEAQVASMEQVHIPQQLVGVDSHNSMQGNDKPSEEATGQAVVTDSSNHKTLIDLGKDVIRADTTSIDSVVEIPHQIVRNEDDTKIVESGTGSSNGIPQLVSETLSEGVNDKKDLISADNMSHAEGTDLESQSDHSKEIHFTGGKVDGGQSETTTADELSMDADESQKRVNSFDENANHPNAFDGEHETNDEATARLGGAGEVLDNGQSPAYLATLRSSVGASSAGGAPENIFDENKTVVSPLLTAGAATDLQTSL